MKRPGQRAPATPHEAGDRRDRGSALVMAIFVLVVLTAMGTALLFMSQSEVQMSQASLREKQAFYMAEAGLEAAREGLLQVNGRDDFGEELIAAAGADGAIDFDVDNLAVVYDASGRISNLTGYGDDDPVVDLAKTPNGEGWYAAFLTNDFAEGETTLADLNLRVKVTAIGGGLDDHRSTEIVQAVIELRDLLPPVPPAAITLLGPNPNFAGGSSAAKQYAGDDCLNYGGGVPGLYVPTVGTIDSTITSGVTQPGSYATDSGTHTGYDSTADVNDAAGLAAKFGLSPIDPDWLDCQTLHDIVEDTRLSADVVCTPPTACTLPPSAPDRWVMVDGDWTIGPTGSGQGFLLVTGSLTMHGNADWEGLILVIGEGQFLRNGAGNGQTAGGVVVADIAGPDNLYGTADDCTGGDQGFAQASFDENGGGTGDTEYCTVTLDPAMPVRPYKIIDFLQR